ncbi:MAG: hypothetical protein CW338_01545 [Clostridiales bacterium]|nr:hypothetical protein [Clostridiales bacterium]
MRKLSVILVLILLTAVCGAAAEEITRGDYTYMLYEDGTAAITGYTGTDTVLVLPAEVEGRPVTLIGEWAFAEKTAVSITVPEGVKVLGDCAFAKSDTLEEVILPASIEAMGDNPFNGCGALVTISIPPENTRFEMSGSGLYDNEELRLISYLLTGPETVGTVRPGTKVIGGYAIHFCDRLTTVTLPASLERIDEMGFMGNENLTTLTIPQNVTSIGSFAFAFCSDLVSLSLPANVAYFGDNPFYDCRADLVIDVPLGSMTQTKLEEMGWVLTDR